MLFLYVLTSFASVSPLSPGATLGKMCSMQTQATCDGPSSEGGVCMWNAEKFKCNSVESAHKNDDYCKRYGFQQSQQCQADPRCMWDAADFECSPNKMPAGLPGMPFSPIAQGSATVPSTGAITPVIPSTGTLPQAPVAPTPSSPQALARIPCEMRAPAQCKGRSPRGGTCYMSGMECDEAEAGDLDVLCVQFRMNPTGCQAHPQCFWDASDFECTHISEQEIIPINGGVPGSLPGFSASSSTSSSSTATGSSASSQTISILPGILPVLPSSSTGGSASAPASLPGMPLNCEYLLDMSQCTAANGCILKKYECKNLEREMPEREMPERGERPETPEGMFPLPSQFGAQTGGDSGRPSPFAPSLKKAHQQSPNENNGTPVSALIFAAGFLGSFCGVVLYRSACTKRRQTNDVLLTEYSEAP